MPENNAMPDILPPAQASAEFPLTEDPGGVIALFEERLRDGGGLPILDLPRIRVPSGGGLQFRIDTAAGEENARKLEGVIVAYRSARIYWKSRAAGKRPPDCSSIDGFIGAGDPGGECAQCPNARFGSGFKADGSPSGGQACKDVRQILFLLKGEMLPHLLNVPPTSVKAFNQYTLNLLSARAAYWGAITEITLEKAESADHIDYAKIAFRLGRRMNELAPAFQNFHALMRGVLKPALIDAGAYESMMNVNEAPARQRLPSGFSVIPDANAGSARPPSGGPEFRPEGEDDIPF